MFTRKRHFKSNLIPAGMSCCLLKGPLPPVRTGLLLWHIRLNKCRLNKMSKESRQHNHFKAVGQTFGNSLAGIFTFRETLVGLSLWSSTSFSFSWPRWTLLISVNKQNSYSIFHQQSYYSHWHMCGRGIKNTGHTKTPPKILQPDSQVSHLHTWEQQSLKNNHIAQGWMA